MAIWQFSSRHCGSPEAKHLPITTLLLLCRPKSPQMPLRPTPPLPNILTIRLRPQLLLLHLIPLLNKRLPILPRPRLQPHTKAPISPMFRTRLQFAVAVDVVEVSAKGAAVEGAVEGCAAGHCAGVFVVVGLGVVGDWRGGRRGRCRG